jgi:glycosyltransferase involved in cell wall biosynthesis
MKYILIDGARVEAETNVVLLRGRLMHRTTASAAIAHSVVVQPCLEPDLVSILIPVYNEEEFVGVCLKRVLEAPLPEGIRRELIVVDDCSTDDSLKIAQSVSDEYPGQIRIFRHERNMGKGAAIRSAIADARGTFSIIQDADLEYDPRDYTRLLEPLVYGTADAVYGSRFQSSGRRRVLYFWHAVGNKLLTLLCNMASDLNLTDMETCYKAFRTALVQSIPLRSNRFGIEPEITIKLSQRLARLYEVPISYNGRTYAEGKKIGSRDAFQALLVILRFWLIRDIYRERGPEILDVLADAPRFNRWMAETIRPFLGRRIMEIGAGIGNLTAHLSRRCAIYVTSDIDEEHLARLRNRFAHRPKIHVHKCDLEVTEDFQAFAGSMDTVVCLNVLEHVQKDLVALANLHSILEEDGRALILVPQSASIYGTLDVVLGHHRRYSVEELRSKLEQSGFEIERMIEFNRITWPAWFINGRIFRKQTFSRFQIRVFDRLVPLWKALDRALPWPSVSIIAVAKKRMKAARPSDR